MKVKNAKNGRKALVDISLEELSHLLKLQIPCEILSVVSHNNNETINGRIKLSKRFMFGNKIPKIHIISGTDVEQYDIPKGDYSHKEIWNYLTEMFNAGGHPIVLIQNNEFNQKSELLGYIGKFNNLMINGCGFIDYSDDMFSIISIPKPKNPNKLYFWPKLKTMFMFTEEPLLLFGVEKTLDDLLL